MSPMCTLEQLIPKIELVSSGHKGHTKQVNLLNQVIATSYRELGKIALQMKLSFINS